MFRSVALNQKISYEKSQKHLYQFYIKSSLVRRNELFIIELEKCEFLTSLRN